ncbi:hypothetical protein EON63_18040, partial [archaeon]
PLNPDVTKPQVSSSNPTANAIDIPENQAISIKFNEALSSKSIRAGVFSLKEQGSLAIEGGLKLVSEGKELLFTPNDLLKDYTEYVIRIEGVRDMAGNTLSAPFTFKYKTGNTIDTVMPTVLAMTPISGSSDIPVNSLLTFVMSEQIDPTTVSDSNLYVTDSVSSQKLSGSLSVSEDKLTISFTPNRAFFVGRTHQIYVSGIKDLFGNEMYASYFGMHPSLAITNSTPIPPTPQIPLPPRLQSKSTTSICTDQDAYILQEHLHHTHRIEVPVKCLGGRLYVRVSVHVYNDQRDLDRLIQVIRNMV